MVARARPRPEAPTRPGAALHRLVSQQVLCMLYVTEPRPTEVEELQLVLCTQPLMITSMPAAEQRQTRTEMLERLRNTFVVFQRVGLNTC